MANEIKWDCLTPEEAVTLAALVNSGEEAYPAPIVIEQNREARKVQFQSLGISWEQCRTWRIGSETVLVHPTPATKAVYDLLLSDLRAKHRTDYRKRRCQIPGKLKATITCPECNKCKQCPYPEWRDKHQAQELSWDGLIEKGYEGDPCEDAEIRKTDLKMDLDAVCKVIDARNPLYTKAIVLKEYYGLSVDEIAEQLHTTTRNVYEYIRMAKEIGKKIKEDNGNE